MFCTKKETKTGDEKDQEEEEEERQEEKKEKNPRNSFLDFQKAVFGSFFFFINFFIIIYFLNSSLVLPTNILKPVSKTNFPDKLKYGANNILNKVATKLALFLNGGGTTDKETVTKGFFLNY
jgi:hypothetical protein